jgi:hypothetical protein
LTALLWLLVICHMIDADEDKEGIGFDPLYFAYNFFLFLAS